MLDAATASGPPLWRKRAARPRRRRGLSLRSRPDMPHFKCPQWAVGATHRHRHGRDPRLRLSLPHKPFQCLHGYEATTSQAEDPAATSPSRGPEVITGSPHDAGGRHGWSPNTVTTVSGPRRAQRNPTYGTLGRRIPGSTPSKVSRVRVNRYVAQGHARYDPRALLSLQAQQVSGLFAVASAEHVRAPGDPLEDRGWSRTAHGS